jgi:hypothetical protein
MGGREEARRAPLLPVDERAQRPKHRVNPEEEERAHQQAGHRDPRPVERGELLRVVVVRVRDVLRKPRARRRMTLPAGLRQVVRVDRGLGILRLADVVRRVAVRTAGHLLGVPQAHVLAVETREIGGAGDGRHLVARHHLAVVVTLQAGHRVELAALGVVVDLRDRVQAVAVRAGGRVLAALLQVLVVRGLKVVLLPGVTTAADLGDRELVVLVALQRVDVLMTLVTRDGEPLPGVHAAGVLFGLVLVAAGAVRLAERRGAGRRAVFRRGLRPLDRVARRAGEILVDGAGVGVRIDVDGCDTRRSRTSLRRRVPGRRRG